MYGGKKHHLVSSTTKENVFKLKKIYISISFFFVFRKQITRKFLTLPQGFHNYYRCTNCALCTVQNTVFTCFWYFTS